MVSVQLRAAKLRIQSNRTLIEARPVQLLCPFLHKNIETLNDVSITKTFRFYHNTIHGHGSHLDMDFKHYTQAFNTLPQSASH